MDAYFDWEEVGQYGRLRIQMKPLEMTMMMPPEPPVFRSFMFADFGMPVLDSRVLVRVDGADSLLDEIRQFIHEVELRLCNDAIDEVYRDVGGEG